MMVLFAMMIGTSLKVSAQGQELQPVPLEELPAATQKLFVERAGDFVWIDKTLWSIEVKNRFESIRSKFTSPDTLAPYEHGAAPHYYDMVDKRRSLDEDGAVRQTPGLSVLRGRLDRELPEGLLVRLPDARGTTGSQSQTVLIAGLTREDVNPQSVRAVVRRDGMYQYKVGNKVTTLPKYQYSEQWVRPASPAEVYEYFVRHGIEGFPFLTPRETVMLSDGRATSKFEWDNKPVRVQLPAMRETMTKPKLRTLDELK